MSRVNDNVYTVYDVLDKKGYYSRNPANAQSFDPATKESLYKGPVEFPKMYYHPMGERVNTNAGEVISTPLGAKIVGEQWELIHTIVANKAEEMILKAEGWHDQPWKADKAAGRDVSKIEKARASAPMTQGDRDDYIASLEAKLQTLGVDPKEIASVTDEMKKQAGGSDGAQPDARAALANAFAPTEALLERVKVPAAPTAEASALRESHLLD